MVAIVLNVITYASEVARDLGGIYFQLFLENVVMFAANPVLFLLLVFCALTCASLTCAGHTKIFSLCTDPINRATRGTNQMSKLHINSR